MEAFDAHTEPDLSSVLAWAEFQRAALAEAQSEILKSLRYGHTPSPWFARAFRGQTWEEVEAHFQAQRRRLDLLTMFELLAMTEAILRLDLQDRVHTRRKDSLSRRFRELHKVRPRGIRLKEHLLQLMEEEGVVTGKALNDFRRLLRLRHWLAHGRHWNPKLGRSYTPGDVYDISRRFLEAAGLTRS